MPTEVHWRRCGLTPTLRHRLSWSPCECWKLGNLLFAALATTTLASLIIPFFGVVATIGRAAFIGMPYAPTSSDELVAVIVASPVLLIEFQAYVLAMLGSINLWRSTFGYRRRNVSSA